MSYLRIGTRKALRKEKRQKPQRQYIPRPMPPSKAANGYVCKKASDPAQPSFEVWNK